MPECVCVLRRSSDPGILPSCVGEFRISIEPSAETRSTIVLMTRGRSRVNVNIHEPNPARLAVRRSASGAVIVEIAGNWLDRTRLPDVGTVERELARGGKGVLEFQARELGRWDSALMARILAIHDLCARGNVEFRATTLPDGLAKLIALAGAVPEKKDAVRASASTDFL